MALIPFDGELDAPVAGLTPFAGRLDGEDEGIVSSVKKGLGDIGLKLNVGATVAIPEQVVGINDLARKTTPLGMLSEAIAPEFVKKARGSFEDAGRKVLNERRDDLSAEMSPAQQAADKKSYFTDEAAWSNLAKDGITAVPGKVADLAAGGKLFGDGWSDWRKVTGSAAESLPGTVVTMGPTFKVAGTAYEQAFAATLAKTGSEAAAKAAGTKAAERAAMLAGGAAEGMQGAGAANESTRRAVMEMPAEKIAQSPFFQAEIKANGGDVAAARVKAADAAATMSAGVAFLFDATLGVIGDKYIGSAAAGKGTRSGAVARGTAQETPTEFAQSGGEKFGENLGVREFADPSQLLMAGVGEEATAGGLAGGLTGGMMGGALHRGAAPTLAARLPQLPDTGPMSRSANIALATQASELPGNSLLGNAAPEVAPEAPKQQPTNLAGPDRVAAIADEESRIQSRLAEINDPVSGYGPAFDTERAELAATGQSLAQERDSITANWPKATAGAPTTFSTESGTRINATYALVNAADLNTSHDERLKPNTSYPAELQPRERDRAASEVQVSGIVQRLDPARLGASADAATGAPIIGADGLVESGNARTIALKRAYQAAPEKAAEYRQYLKDNAAQFGITPEAVDAMQSPVLVRIRNTPVDRAEFARQANASTVAQMSSSETAKADAARLDVMDDLNPDDNGDFATSRDFIRRFVSRLPGTEQAGMVDANGQLSQAGYTRIRNAILAKAYGDSPVLTRMVESLDDNLRNIGKALMAAAPAVAKLRQDVGDGALFDADITPDLMAAVEELSRIKDAGRSVADALAQAGMFGDGISTEAQDLLRFLDQNIRRPRKIAEFIQRYTEALRAAGNPNQGSLLGERQAPAKQEMINAAKEMGNAPAEQAGQPQGSQGAGPEDQGQPRGAQGNGSSAQGYGAANDEVNPDEWKLFGPETGTLGIPRAEMPQVAIRLRPAMLSFLESHGIGHVREDVAADQLKPTQAEYSTVKAARAGALAEDRSDASAVLLSSDGYVLDGHHRWIAKAQQHQPINVIRFDAPIDRLLDQVREFSGVTVSSGSPELLAKRTQAVENFYDAAGDLAQILTKHTRAAMVPEKTPDLMPTLVKLFDSAFDVVGTDVKRATAWVKNRLKAMPELKKVWNKILPETYQKAALQAVESYDPNRPAPGGQMGLFAAPSGPAQPDLFRAPPAAVIAEKATEPKSSAPKTAMIDGRPYDMKRDNFKPAEVDSFLPAGVLAEANGYVDKYFKDRPAPALYPADVKRAEEMLSVLIEKAKSAKADYDQKIIDIAKRSGAMGQMIAPIKGMPRSVQKLIVDEGFNIGGMKDMLRSTIVVSDYAKAQAVMDEIAKEFTLTRKPKNRTGSTALVVNGEELQPEDPKKYGGYTDVLVNITMPNGVIAEIQINVPEMLSAKEAQGHKLYEAYRDAPKDSPLGREINASMLGFYQAAFDAAQSRAASASATNPAGSSENAMPPSGPLVIPGRGSSVSPSSNNLNQAPSGNSTNQSPPKVGTNRQPLGNTAGNFISTTSESSIAEGEIQAYTNDNGNQDGVANEQRSQAGSGSPEGQEPGAVQRPAAQRKADGVRPGSSGRNSVGNRDAADGNRSGQRGQQDEGSIGEGRDSEHGGRTGARGSVRRDAGIPAGRDIAAKTGRNYAFGDADLTYDGSWLVKARQNVEALELLKQLEADGRQATKDEQAKLARFIGWGSSEMANTLFGDKLTKQMEALDQYDAATKALANNSQGYLTRRDTGFYQAFMVLNAKQGDLGYYQVERITKEQLEKAKPDPAARKWADLRDRIKKALSPDEWKEASRSTQYAHYTSKPVVKAMWSALERMGFKGGAILEPGAGIGVFPGLMSSAMANNSIYTGIEFDSITGGILKQLFPDERILVESFIDSKLPKNFYDVAAGNPPFNNTAILADPQYKKHAFALHDYFFAKSIDSVKPGGLVMFVTSRYTMDKLNDKARAYLADRADLVGAIRLPQTAFKKNAGTDVVTDVLFLRKKVDGETFAHAQPWAKSVPMQVGKKSFPVNEYFHAHPEMVLGTPSDKGKMANSPEPQYTVEAKEGDIDELFAMAAATLPDNIYQAERGSSAEAAAVREIDFNPKAQKEGNFYVTEAGVLMQREGGVGVRADQHLKNIEVIKDFVGLRDALKQAHYDQLNDGDWEKSLALLKKAYAAFVKKNGQINQFTEMRRSVQVEDPDTGETIDDERSYKRFPLINKIQDDPDYSLVMALESINDETGKISESPFLSERVLGKPDVQEIKTPADALLSVLNDIGHVDIETIADRLDMGRQETIDALGTMIYEDPAAGWVMADEYLSGNVKKKLQAAQESVKSDRRYDRNIEALLAAQPVPVPPSDITVAIGMNWIPAATYEQFLHEKTGIRAKVIYNERTGQWSVTAQSGTSTLAATQEWGTPRRSADDILLAALTGAPIRITETVKDAGGSKTVFLADATEAANQKLIQMREAFREWMWQDAGRTDKLVALYNDTFNTIVPRAFDGRHLTLPGTSKKWKVFDHVKRGAWRIIQSGNTYLAHAVGSGKTFEMIISAMEQKRLGLIKKPMIVVPNHMLQQFAREWIDLYPAARLMVADEKNFHTENRRRFSSRVAMSDLDGVIITHSAFKLLDLDPAFKQQMIEQELDYLRAAFEEAGGEAGTKSRDPKIKQIESKIEKMEQKLEAAMSGAGKDKNVRFDEMGVDMVYVDEAHEFRKLAFATQRQVKGIDSSGSDRAFDLWMKTRWLEQKKPGRSLVMASGTPVTNTLAELYSVQRFMAPDVLEERGLDEFDAWASMFGQEHTEIEADASGKYAPVTRFSKFVNVPELTQMFREFADVLTSDHLAAMLGDKRPKVKDGSRKIVITPQTAAYQGFKKELADRLAESRAWKPSRDEPNNPDPVIKIIGDGRLASIDMRFIDPLLPNDPDSKLNRMADEVIRVFKETADFEYKDKAGAVEPNKGATQIVFSDLGFGAGVAENRGFNARAWFEKRLRDAGVPASQVAFMSDHKKSQAKLKLFKDINAGRVRIVVGSSKNMGTGVNAQQRLIALHHLDTPWFPADLEQREGRIVRQGNKNPLVQLYAYSTKGSYDAVMWQMLASKQRFIDQALSGDSSVRSIDDLSESSQFQIATAMTSDDERAIQLAGLRAEIEKLQRLYRAHEEQRSKMRQEYDWAGETIRLNEQKLPEAKQSASKIQDLSGDNFTAKADGRSFTTRKEFGEALMARFKDFSDKLGETPVKIGSVSGFDVFAMGRTGQNGVAYQAGVVLKLPDPVVLTEAPTADPVGVSLKATNALANLARLPAQLQQKIEEAKAKRNALEARITAPFPMAEMLSDKIKEAQDLETAMLADQNKLTGIEREQQLEDLWQQKTGAITPLFSRGAGSGMAVRDLTAVVDRVSKRLKNLPKVHVLESPAGLSTKDPMQKALRDFIRKAGAWSDVEGATHEGEIYLFASGLADEARAEYVLAVHEVTHYGLRGAVGKDLDAALQEVWVTNAKVRKAAADLKERYGLQSNIEATEEVLADMALGDLMKLVGWRRVVKAIRNWLSRAGFERLAARFDAWMKKGLTEQQQADVLVADLVTAARDWVRNGKGRPYMDGTRLADGSLADDLAEQEAWLMREAKARGYQSIDEMAEKNYTAFENLAKLWRDKHPVDGALLSRSSSGLKKWFAGSKVVDEDGEPLVMYHGTSADKDFTKFKVGARGAWFASSQDIRFSRNSQTTNPRTTGFDKASGTVVADFKNDSPMKAHPDYKAAKGGDVAAAARLVQALVKPESIQVANDAFGENVIYVPVHAEEAGGRNKIPDAVAAHYAANSGGEVWSGIMQTNRAYHTGANAMERLLARAEFSGEVEPGRRYVLVDDVTTMGSTLADLARYIRSKGGEIAGAVVLVNAARSGKMIPDRKTVKELEARHGNEISKLFDVEPGALTWSESQYLLGFRTTDELRNRVAKARSERSARLLAKGVSESESATSSVTPRLSRANQAPQVQQSTAAQRAEEIISKPAASWKPVDIIMRTLTTTVRLDRLTSAIYDRAGQLLDRYTPEEVKAGVVADYGIPEAVIDQRTMMQGRMRVQLRKSGELIDKLATLTRAESRVAYEWMNNADPQAAAYFEAQLPPESLAVMEEVKTMIDKLSQEAVSLGQLDPETFKRNRFEYLRRSYIKHTTELTKAETSKRKRAIAILGEQYKGRGMAEAIDMAKFKNVAPEWWGRKLQDGKADKGLKGEKFIRLERRASVGDGVPELAPAVGPGNTNPQPKGRLLETIYWPAGESLPAKYSTWDQAGTWEVRDAKGGKLIVWRDFTKQERVAMGEIDEARYAMAKSLHGMIHDVETGRYLEWLGRAYGKKPGEAIDGDLVEASERMRDVFKPGEWVQVPETKIPGTSVLKYGKLAGRIIPGPVWNDVRQVVGFRFKPLGETYAAILGAWKTAKTALSPAVHTNNVMANFVMADWHDVGAGHILKALRIILGASQRQGKGLIGRTGNALSRAGMVDVEAAREILQRYGDSGANMGSWVTSELQRDQIEPLLEALEKEIGIAGQTVSSEIGVMAALQKALQLRFPSAWEAFKPTLAGKAITTEAGSLIDLYEAEDQVFRLAAWLKAKEDGAGDLAAGKIARRSFLDYNINAPWVQVARNTALPFISFTYRAAPMILETAARKPHKLMKLALVAGALNALGYLLSGGDEDDERALLPEEKSGSIFGVVPKLIRMPWNDANGSPVFLDIRRFIPVGDIFDLGATHAAVPMLPFTVPGGPLALASELVANKSQFTGRPITLETDTASEKAIKVADHLYKAFAPNIIILPGTYAWTGASNAATGRTDSFGREQSTAQAAASAFGVKIGSYPKDVLQLNAQRAAQAKMMEIDRNITQLKRELQRGGVDDKEFAEKLDAQIAKKVGVVDEFKKKMGGG